MSALFKLSFKNRSALDAEIMKQMEEMINNLGELPHYDEVEHIPIRKLFIGNIDKRAKPSQLYQVFSPYGEVVNAFIAHKGVKNRHMDVSFGFVTFRNAEDAETVLGKIRGFRLYSKWLKIKPADSWHQPLERPDGTVDYSSNILMECRKASNKCKNNEDECSNAILDATCDDEQDESANEDLGNVESSEINRLNDDCLWHIFSYLTIDVQIKASKVCQRWQTVVKDMWGKKEQIDLKDFSFSSDPIKACDLQPVLEFFGPNVKEIICNTEEVALATKLLIFLISRYCINLEILDVTDVAISPRTLLLLSKQCQNLKDVRISGCTDVTDSELAYLLNSSNSKVETLHLDNLPNLNGHCFAKIKSPLKFISIKMCAKLSLQCLIENTRQVKDTLKSLIIEDCMGTNGVDLSKISRNVPKLTRLTLCDVFHYCTMPSFGFGKFTEMQILDLSFNDTIDDDVIRDIAGGCLQLKKFKLCGPLRRPALTKQGIMWLSKMTWLDDLDISYLHQIDDDVLKAFANCSTPSKLTTFKCEHCENVGDIGMASILTACPGLQLIDMGLCKLITNETVMNALKVVRQRQNNKSLTISVFGTGISIPEDNSKFVHPLLIINSTPNCTLEEKDFFYRCRRDFLYSDMGFSDLEDDDDDDDDDDFFDDEFYEDDEECRSYFDSDHDEWFDIVCGM